MADQCCETCGKLGDPMRVLQDTYFCPECWADFRSGKWKGIGSKLPTTQKASEGYPAREDRRPGLLFRESRKQW